MKGRIILAWLLIAAILAGIVGILVLRDQGKDSEVNTPYIWGDITYSSLNNFNSFQEIQNFLTVNSELSQYYYSYPNMTKDSTLGMSSLMRDDSFNLALSEEVDSGGDGDSTDHSTTNIQVEGVDEGDIVKNEGKYAYIVNHNRTKVYIIEVFPAEDAKILSLIEVNFSILEIYIYNEKLVIIGKNSIYTHFEEIDSDMLYFPYYSYMEETIVEVFDVEDKENPELTRSVMLNGNHVSSRMVGKYFYIIVNQLADQIESEKDLPVPANEVSFADEYDYYYYFTNIMSINIQDDGEAPNSKVVLMGYSTHIYVSLNNIYLTYTKRMSWVEKMERRVEEVIVPILPQDTSVEVNEVLNASITRREKLSEIDGIIGDYTSTLTEGEKEDFYEEQVDMEDDFEWTIAKEIEKTIVHRISIEKGKIRYEVSGGAPGYILNRFSMSEHREYFRMATTTGQVWSSGTPSKNHVFVLDMNLEIVGSLTDMAPGESIYSARFMGDRAYLVTFKKVDPFFVIDLSIPNSPKILGELKIPGYSNYLHPFDENHVIGIGRDCVDMGNFAWYQGVKLSLFDVTDVNNPKEISKFIIGDRGTDSLALNDPHAFLFSRDKNLLVIPVRLHEVDESEYPEGAPPNAYGDFKWSGAYVLHISVENGFILEGEISHSDDGDNQGEDRWDWYYGDSIKRSFYIEDVLYTVSDKMIKANNLDDLSEIKSLDLDQ